MGVRNVDGNLCRDAEQISEDLATICLSIDRYNYSLVKSARTTKEARHSIRTAFQDSGKYRKISLLRKLIRQELEDCSSIVEYMDKILTYKPESEIDCIPA